MQIDLQLPLYAVLLSSDPGLRGPFELGYFNLPKAVDDTSAVLWDDPSSALLELARALATGADMLLLDEPTASVDNSVEKDIFDLFHALNEKMTIVLVSHDLGFVSSYVNKIACVNRRLVYHGINEVSLETMMRDAYQGAITMIHHRCNL
jgi:ABC-type cobalamin/Fe3+-siderophores transport system ATPase subunit